ncbi:MAG: hypothetical protein ACKVJ6_07755 [Flavobacteriales bacterium]|tara:strand:- start:590 stop:1432 length:843 start_codon:yes stop_codon:yes gene_type:complete
MKNYKNWNRNNSVRLIVIWRYDDYSRENPLNDFNDFNVKSLMELITNTLKKTYTKGNQLPNYYVSLFPKSERINTYNLNMGEGRKGFWEDDTYYDFYYQHKTEEEEEENRKFFLKEEEIRRKENYNRRMNENKKRSIHFEICDSLIEGKWLMEMKIYRYRKRTSVHSSMENITYKDYVVKETKTFNTLYDLYDNVMYMCQKWDKEVFTDVFFEEMRNLKKKYNWNIPNDTFKDFYNDKFIPQIKSMGEDYCKFWLRKKEEDSEDFEFKCWVNKNWENLTD